MWRNGSIPALWCAWEGDGWHGNACSKFFHANGTIRHRQNLITTLEDNDENIICKHEEKAKLLWEACKYRLGTSKFSNIYFKLHALLASQQNLLWLEDPFFKRGNQYNHT
jgi:hypothetical protein